MIESILAQVSVTTGTHPLVFVGAPDEEVLIPTLQQGTGGGLVDFYLSASPAIRLYVPAGSVSVTVSLSNGGGVGDTVVGHLVPAP